MKSIRKFTNLLILVILTISNGFTWQTNAQNPILEYVGAWTGELTIETKLVNSSETHEEWKYYIEPSFKIDSLGCLDGTASVRFIPMVFSILVVAGRHSRSTISGFGKMMLQSFWMNLLRKKLV